MAVKLMNVKNILRQFDERAKEFTFPMLDNGYVYLVDQRLSIFRSNKVWMMTIEIIGFNHRAFGVAGMENFIYFFGNNLSQTDDVLLPVPNSQGKIFVDDNECWAVKPRTKTLKVRSKELTLNLTSKALGKKGIELIEPPLIDPPAVMRSLFPEHRKSFLATSGELKKRNPGKLPLLLQLDEWNHPDLCTELPSQTETFPMLAKVIETGDVTHYQPTLEPNTHWLNWPEGGML